MTAGRTRNTAREPRIDWRGPRAGCRYDPRRKPSSFVSASCASPSTGLRHGTLWLSADHLPLGTGLHGARASRITALDRLRAVGRGFRTGGSRASCISTHGIRDRHTFNTWSGALYGLGACGDGQDNKGGNEASTAGELAHGTLPFRVVRSAEPSAVRRVP